MGRNKVLSDEHKRIIREGYEKKLSCKEILAQIQETFPKAKKHHVWAYAWTEGLTNPPKRKERKVPDGCFDINLYMKQTATI